MEEPSRARRGGGASGDLDSFTLLLRDVVRYPLLDAKGEVELVRAIEAGARANEERGAPGENRSRRPVHIVERVNRLRRE